MADTLLQTIKQAAQEAATAGRPFQFSFGEVITTNPLSIRVEQRMTLTESFFILTRAVVDHYVDITVSHVTENRAGGGGDAEFASHNHDYAGRKKILVHNGLQVGEKVILLQQAGGQQYVVLDRATDHITGGQWL